MEEQTLGSILWRGRAVLVLAVIASTVLVGLATILSERVYRATAVLQVGPATVASGGNESALSTQQASQGLAREYASLLESDGFLQRIRRRLPGRPSVAELHARVSAKAVPDTGLIELAAEGSSRLDASRLANRVARGFVNILRADAAAASRELVASGREQLAQLADQLAAARGGDAATRAVRASLIAAQTAVNQQMARGAAQSIEPQIRLTAPPVAGGSPIRPRPVLNLLAAIILGTLIGTALAYLQSRMRPALSSAQEAEEALGAPLLATIPLRRPFSMQDPVLAEAFETLRSKLAFRFGSAPGGVITFMSHGPAAGTTSVVEGLAAAIARSRRSVLVIDGDLRTRELSSRLGKDTTEYFGVSTILDAVSSGKTTAPLAEMVDEAVVEVSPGVTLLRAGPGHADPPAILKSAAMRELLEHLSEQFQVILIDAPPTAEFADARILASLADAVVLVARIGRTTRENLRSAAQNLGDTRTPLTGVVVVESRFADLLRFGGQAPDVVDETPAGVPG